MRVVLDGEVVWMLEVIKSMGRANGSEGHNI